MYKTAVDTVFYIYVIVQSHRNVYISRLYMDYFDSFTRNSMKASENREDQDQLYRVAHICFVALSMSLC